MIQKQKNPNQSDLAELLGANQSVMARWESNKIRPRRPSLVQLAQPWRLPLERCW